MFTWICPQCGREVPPSYSECPTCAENRQRAAQGLPPLGAEPQQPAPPPPPPPAQPAYAPPQPYPPPQPQAYPPAPQASPQPYPPQAYYPPQPPQQQQAWPPPQQPVYTLPDAAPSKGFPVWLVLILVIAGLSIVLFSAYKLLGGRSDAPSMASTSAANTGAAQPGAQTSGANPYAKMIEITGVRIAEDDKQHPVASFVVVNHASADLPDLELNVVLRSVNAAPGDDPVATVAIKTGPLPANGIKDISAPIQTKLRAYELPDWQFLRASFDVK